MTLLGDVSVQRGPSALVVYERNGGPSGSWASEAGGKKRAFRARGLGLSASPAFRDCEN